MASNRSTSASLSVSGRWLVELGQVERGKQVGLDDLLALEVADEMAQRDDEDLHRGRRELAPGALRCGGSGAGARASERSRLDGGIFLFQPRGKRFERRAIDELAADGVTLFRGEVTEAAFDELPATRCSRARRGHDRLFSSASTPGSRTSAQAGGERDAAQLVAGGDAGLERVRELVLAAGRFLRAAR